MSSVPQHPVIRGKQVFLRPPERDDVPTFVRWFTDARVLDHLAMRAPMSEASEAAWFDRMLAAQGKTDHMFVICLLGNGKPIGTVGLHGIDWENGTAEFGIAIGETSEWNKGHGTDALRAICDFGFGALRLERIGLHVYAGNVAGQRAYEKAGFRHEGTLRDAHYARGQREDVNVMGLLREEWAAQDRPRSWDL